MVVDIWTEPMDRAAEVALMGRVLDQPSAVYVVKDRRNRSHYQCYAIFGLAETCEYLDSGGRSDEGVANKLW
jgi:hypothetical protein